MPAVEKLGHKPPGPGLHHVDPSRRDGERRILCPLSTHASLRLLGRLISIQRLTSITIQMAEQRALARQHAITAEFGCATQLGIDHMRYLHLPSGAPILALGLGTWRMGEAGSSGADIVKALRLGIDLGMTLIDTAEMYGEGGAEELVGKAIAGRRGDVFLVSKVYPHNATRQGAV